jgi:antitoxin component of RelBE/YafQ-DinJ toxin-antitoxin module
MASRAISVRLDDDAMRALATLEALGMSRSEAIRRALLDSAQGLRRRQDLRAELTALEADEEDRQEMLEVAALMESLRAAR